MNIKVKGNKEASLGDIVSFNGKFYLVCLTTETEARYVLQSLNGIEFFSIYRSLAEMNDDIKERFEIYKSDNVTLELS